MSSDLHILNDILKKYNSDPNNKSLFLQLCKIFREKGLNDSSYYFGKKYLKYNPDDPDINYELSIVSFYVGDMNQGYSSCEKILLDFKADGSLKNSIKENLYYYINQIDIIKKK